MALASARKRFASHNPSAASPSAVELSSLGVWAALADVAKGGYGRLVFQQPQPARRVLLGSASNSVDTPFLQAATFEHEHERRTPNAKRLVTVSSCPFVVLFFAFFCAFLCLSSGY
jgi:hypothetical protein